MGAPFRKRRYLTWKPLGIHVPALSFRGFSVGMIDRGLRSGPLHCRLRAWRAYTTTKDGGALKTQQENGRKNRGLRLSFFFAVFSSFLFVGLQPKKKNHHFYDIEMCEVEDISSVEDIYVPWRFEQKQFLRFRHLWMEKL